MKRLLILLWLALPLSWKKTRHYVACNYDITSWMQLEAYYLYYTHNGRPPQHILGIGMNFYL